MKKAIVVRLNELIVELGGLDLLVVSSGTGDLNDKMDFEIEKRTIDTNVLGFTNIVDLAFDFFKNQKSGHFVAITSIGGLSVTKATNQIWNAIKKKKKLDAIDTNIKRVFIKINGKHLF
jgi:NADP-dependent 3-hydroxy acid dehydrogenase YdfG